MSTAYAVTVQLSENQKRQLGVEMKKSIQDGHYGAAYTYLYNNIPKSDYHGSNPAYTREEAALKTWLNVASVACM